MVQGLCGVGHSRFSVRVSESSAVKQFGVYGSQLELLFRASRFWLRAFPDKVYVARLGLVKGLKRVWGQKLSSNVTDAPNPSAMARASEV